MSSFVMRHKCALLICCALAVVACFVCMSDDSSAVEVVDSGTEQGVNWVLTDDGTLTLTRVQGSTYYLDTAPWVTAGYGEQITTMEITNSLLLRGVHLFENLPNLSTLIAPIDFRMSEVAIGNNPYFYPFGTNSISTFIFTPGSGAGAQYWDQSSTPYAGAHSYNNTPWQKSTAIDKTLIFNEGVTSIGRNMLHVENVAEIVLPSTLSSIAQDNDKIIPRTLTVQSSAGLHFYDSGVEELTVSVVVNCTFVDTLTSIHLTGITGGDYGKSRWSCAETTIVTMDDTIEYLGSYMFSGCPLTNITLPSSLQSMGVGLFSESNIRSITIPSTVESIPDEAFQNCSQLSEILMNPGITDIGNNAFYGCTSLESITIPESVTSIGSQVFYGCTSLNSFIGVFDDYVAFSDNVFNGCTSLSTVTIESASTIVLGDNSFNGCTSLESVSIQSLGNVTLGNHAFKDCNLLETVVVTTNDSVQLGDCVFEDCTSLSSVTINSINVVSFGDCAFIGCTAINSISSNAGRTRFGVRVCQNNTSIRNITIGGSAEVGNNAFEGCINLRTFDTADENSRYGTEAFKGCVLLNASISINTPYAIGEYAFYNCNSLNTVTLGSNVTSIGEYAFYNCNSAVMTIDASSATEIGEYAFYNCSGITTLTLGSSLEGIGGYAFYSCINISSPLVIGANVVSVGDNAFYNCSRIPSLTIAERNVDTNIGESAFHGCSSIAGALVIPDRVFTVGSGAFRNCVRITSVTLSADMTSISSYTFYGCSRIEGTITISNPIESIGDYAFYGCRSITGTLTIPSSLRAIGSYAFGNCSGFNGALLIPSSVSSIGDNAFDSCTGIDAVTFYGGMTSTGTGAFNGCESIEVITFSAELYGIASGTFTNCGICYVDCPDNFSLGECEGTTFCYSYQFFTVRFLNDDMSVVSTGEYRYIDDINPPGNPIKPATAEYTYTFAGWSGYSIGIHVITDTDFVATYDATINGYTVIWKNWDGSVLETDNNVPYGSDPIYNSSRPTRESDLEFAYVFSTWTPSLSQVIGDTQYTAVFDHFDRYNTITWKNYDGSILEIDSDVEYGTTPTYDGPAPARGASAQYTYTFTTWSPEIEPVTCSMIYVAVFDYTLNEYTVTWKNYDGTILETDTNVEYGQIPSYDGVTPRRDSTIQYTFTFSNWSPTISETKGNTTYVAVYSTTLNKYVVTWKNDDNSILETDLNVDYGTMPSYDGQTPVKAPTSQYVYVFSSWTPIVSEVTGSATYFAVYNQFSKYSTVIWKNYDGTVLETDTDVEFGVRPTYNGPLPTRNSEGDHAYQFSNWSPSIEPVSGDATYTAVFNQYARYCTVIWRNYDGAVLETDTNVEFGFTPVYDGEVPTRVATAQYTYTFSNWSPAITPVTSNTTYTAVFNQSVNRYTVTWMNWDGTVLENDTNIEYGFIPTYDSATPVRAATPQYTYTFLGWTPSVSAVTTNTTYTAAYTQTANKYTVTWKNFDNTILEIDSEIEYGTMPSFDGSEPAKPADAQYTYSFSGWSPTVSVVTSNVSYTASFSSTVNRYTVVWKNYDGTTLETDSDIEFGSIPSYDGSIPFRASSAQYTYTFTNWSPAVSSVSGNATYTAVFSETVNRYTVIWKNEDGSVLETDMNVEYGTMPMYDGVVPTKASTIQYTYAFTNWSPTVTAVTGNTSYTAVFTPALNNYSVTWKNWDGTTLELDPTVPYGTLPTFDGLTPTRTATSQYSYSFAGWSPTVTAVVGNAIYTAVFDSAVNNYTVSFTVNDNTYGSISGNIVTDVPYGSKVSISGNAATVYGSTIFAVSVANNAQFTYAFSGWSQPDQYEVTGDCTVRASFTQTVNRYTVIWKNYDGTALETDLDVPYGTMPAYDGLTPAKPSTDQYSYTFLNWSPAINAVTQNATYTATFAESVNRYTVTWKNYDGTTLETDINVEFGTTPSYDGLVPSKESNAQYTYSFSGWTPMVATVSGNASYTAVFAETVNRYTVTWKNYDGSTLETDMNVEYGIMPTYNGELPGKPANVQYTYSFTGWSPGLSAVQGDISYTAIFSQTANSYTVTWKNYDGTVLEIDTPVEYGAMPSYDGAVPQKSGTSQYSYTFTSWTPTVSVVTGNAEYIATFEDSVNVYTVSITINNPDYGSVSHDAVTGVPYGTKITVSGNIAVVDGTQVHATVLPNNAQYTHSFITWSLPDQYEVTGNVTLKATLSRTVNEYTITWKNWDGSTLEIDRNVAYGTVPEYDGTTPIRQGTAQNAYTFTNWSPDITAVSGDRTYTAVFESSINTYTVTWVNYDGSILRKDTGLPYGTNPEYAGSSPVRTKNAQYTYAFSDWSPAVVTVTGDATYMATFTSTINSYTVTITLNDASYGSISHTSVNTPYGSRISISDNVAIIDGTNVSAIHTDNSAQYAYRFESWSLPDQYEITENVSLKATFSRTLNTYTVSWKNYDGTTIETDTSVPYGTMPTYDGGTPVRDMSERYTYAFSNWTPTVSQVTGDVVYTARMVESPRLYTISFNVDGEEYYSSGYRFDELIILPSEPVRASTIAFDYRFSGWSGYTSGMTVAGNYVFDAQFTSTAIIYAITFVDSDGSKITKNYVYGDRTVDEPDPYAHAPKGSVASWHDYSLSYNSNQTVDVVYNSYLDYTGTSLSSGFVASSGGAVKKATAAQGNAAVIGTNSYINQWYDHLNGMRYIEIPSTTPDGRSVIAITSIADDGVTDIRFGENIQDVSKNAFNSCTSLRSITVTDSTHFTTENGALLTDSGRTLVAVPYAVGETFVIPSSVNKVQSGAISGNVKTLIVDTRNSSIEFEDNANTTGKDISIQAADGSNVISLSDSKLSASNSSVSLGIESRDFFGEKSGRLILAVVAIVVLMAILQVASAFLSKSIGNRNTWLFLTPIVVSALVMFLYTMYETISLHTDAYFTVATILWFLATFVELGAAFYAFLCANRSKGTTTVRRNGRLLTIAGAALSLGIALSMTVLAYFGGVHVADGLPAYLVVISVATAFTAFLGIIASKKIFSDIRLEQSSTI